MAVRGRGFGSAKLVGASEAVNDRDNVVVLRRGLRGRVADRGNEGWMKGGRERGEINMALIVSSAPPPSPDPPFITPTQSVRRRHFGK